MMTTPRKPSLTVFVQNKIGGVQFFYSNLLGTGSFSDFDERYIVMDSSDDRDAKLTAQLEGAPSKLFCHQPMENRYASFRRLASNLPSQGGIVLTNWPFELACLDARRRPDLTVAHVCHDDYYVQVAREHAGVIDIFIAHNPYFADCLKAQLPADRAGDVYFLPFGIRQNTSIRRAPNRDRPLRVVFIGRLHHTKGALELPDIDDRLREMGVKVEWSILGRGPEQAKLERAIDGRDNFVIESPPDGPSMLQRAALGDVFVLPSQLDGTPLAVMEAMSVGLVPIISEFNPGARWMVPPEAGFICPINAHAMAAILARLDADRDELETRSEVSLAHARKEFEVGEKAQAYATLFARWQTLKRPGRAPARRTGHRLDRPWIPNSLVIALRRLRNRMQPRRE